MQLCPRSAIHIPEGRQRKEFDPEKLVELGQSVRQNGLLHAPVLREEAGQFFLVAGERRLRIIDELHMLGEPLRFNNELVPEGMIPYVNVGQLTEIEAEEIELTENLQRQDLSWQETAAATAKLHSLRSRVAHNEGRVHTVADTAMELSGRSAGSAQQKVRLDLIVAKHLDNPAIANAKNPAEAYKELKRQETARQNVALAEAVGKTFTSDVHRLHNENCLSWMESCEPGTFDVILTDPPYGMGADTFGDSAGRMSNNQHHYKDDYDTWKNLMRAWCPLSYRVAKAQAHAYVFCDIDNFHELKQMMQDAGWYVFRTPFIHTKPNTGRVPLPEEGPRRQWECLLYAIKGHRHVTSIKADVITTAADANTTHGAQKPVALFVDLLMRSVRPGDTVLDSFAGSGTIFPAATQCKVRAVGLELHPEYYAIALQRMKDSDPSQLAAAQSLTNELHSLMS